MIYGTERKKMLAVPGCGAHTLKRLEAAGISRLSDLRGVNSYLLIQQMNLALGYSLSRSRSLLYALNNLIQAAEREKKLSEREKMLVVPLCGERVIERLKSIGITRLADLRGCNPYVLMHQINLAAGRVIWRPPMAIIALTNLIVAAEEEAGASTKVKKKKKSIWAETAHKPEKKRACSK
jgi:nucleotidyltransferase/DNA polymerase involved in DNA repair